MKLHVLVFVQVAAAKGVLQADQVVKYGKHEFLMGGVLVREELLLDQGEDLSLLVITQVSEKDGLRDHLILLNSVIEC